MPSNFDLHPHEVDYLNFNPTSTDAEIQNSFGTEMIIPYGTDYQTVQGLNGTAIEPLTYVADNTEVPEYQNQSSSDSIEQMSYSSSFSPDGIITARELFEHEGQDSPPLIDPFFQSVGIAALVGPSDTGKSSFLRQLAFDIAYGNETFLGYTINARHHSAIYVSTEDDPGSIKRALKIQYDIPDDLEKTERLRFKFSSDILLAELDVELAKCPADIVIIDAFADIFTGQLNANNEVRGFLNAYRDLSLKHQCLIIFLHHTGKWTENKEPNKNNSIGSQGFEAKMRLVVEIRKDPRDRGIRHLCIVKGNYLPDEFKRESIATRFNEHMLFENLGYGVPFDQLKIDPKNLNPTAVNPARERALRLKAETPAHSVRKITEILTDEGYNVGKSAVGEWLKNYEQVSGG